MGAETGIAWTDHTFNPWWGCQRVSPGCEHCYAETFDHRLGGKHWGPQAERRFFGDAHWREPLKWNAAAAKAGRRARVFCASMADVFEDRRDLDGERDRLWELIAETPHLDWQLLTKRPQNIVRMLPWGHLGVQPWPNVWLGTTVEDQKRADERIPELLKVPAAVRFLSVEPLLEEVNLRNALIGDVRWNSTGEEIGRSVLHWVIVGGESGGGARVMLHGWAQRVVDDCAAAGVACFVKQLGGARDKRDDPIGWPADLRVREFPEAR